MLPADGAVSRAGSLPHPQTPSRPRRPRSHLPGGTRSSAWSGYDTQWPVARAVPAQPVRRAGAIARSRQAAVARHPGRDRKATRAHPTGNQVPDRRRPSGLAGCGRRTSSPRTPAGSSARSRTVRPPVRTEPAGAAPSRAAPGADGGDARDQRQQRLAVANVGAGHAKCERQPLPVGQDVQFAALLAPVDRIAPGQRSPLFARTEAASTMAEVQSTSPKVRQEPTAATNQHPRQSVMPHQPHTT